MQRRILSILVGIPLAAVVALTASIDVSLAQSGHFVGTPTCTDTGTQVVCTGKVAGLGGTTFTITVTAPGATADVECTNPGGNVAPGQDFTLTATGTSGPLPTPRNGQYRFSLATTTPVVPTGSCPNEQWTAEVVDVTFTTATITLFEDTTQVDQVTVTVQ